MRLELALLHEIGKITVSADDILGGLAADARVAVAADPLPALIALALPLAWTRDPFDRLLVATALLHRAPLITRDSRPPPSARLPAVLPAGQRRAW
ncbi:MAG TPA: PIN domain-containing protein [Thermoanaerobaculia bacterium]|nr:PIN domain-containing protein [Thermoanaerobaculia bacterium]